SRRYTDKLLSQASKTSLAVFHFTSGNPFTKLKRTLKRLGSWFGHVSSGRFKGERRHICITDRPKLFRNDGAFTKSERITWFKIFLAALFPILTIVSAAADYLHDRPAETFYSLPILVFRRAEL